MYVTCVHMKTYCTYVCACACVHVVYYNNVHFACLMIYLRITMRIHCTEQ